MILLGFIELCDISLSVKSSVIHSMNEKQRKYRETFNKKRLFNYHNNLNKQLEKNLFYQAKNRAKKKNIDFNLELSDIVIPEKCPVLGIKILPAKGNCASPNSPSIDRINSKLGYLKGNIQIISYRANCLKSDGTINEHEKIIEYMKNNKII